MRDFMFLATVLLGLTTACASKSDGSSDGSSSNPTGMDCTEIGCEDGLQVMVTPNSSWPHGAYVITIEADGATTTCTGALPLPPCETRGLSCDGPSVIVGESGCALDSAEHAFGDITFASAPTTVTVSVDLDGAGVGSQTWTPTYVTVQPNGPDCGPTCTNATVDLALTF